MLHAGVCRQDRLKNRTRGELAFDAILQSMGIAFVAEKIFKNGDNYILADFYLPDLKLVIEIDGPHIMIGANTTRDATTG
jgi:very-short-patch-repair endonuclease